MYTKKIFLHRGIISSNYKENSYEGILESVKKIKNKETIATGIEFDICLTKDNKFIIYHPVAKKLFSSDNNYYTLSELKKKNKCIIEFEELVPFIIENSEIDFLIDLKVSPKDKKKIIIYLNLFLLKIKNLKNVKILINSVYLAKILNNLNVEYIYMLYNYNSTKKFCKDQDLNLPRIRSLLALKYITLPKKMRFKSKILLVDNPKKNIVNNINMIYYNSATKNIIKFFSDKDIIIDYNKIKEYTNLTK